jgi:hypothetical protein
MGTSKAAIGAAGKRTFFVQKHCIKTGIKTGLQTGARMANLRALLTNLWQ